MQVGLDFGQDAITKMVADADLNGDGCIDYEEFARLWKDHVVHVQYEPLVERLTRVRRLVPVPGGCDACGSKHDDAAPGTTRGALSPSSGDRKLLHHCGVSQEASGQGARRGDTAVAFDSAMVRARPHHTAPLY